MADNRSFLESLSQEERDKERDYRSKGRVLEARWNACGHLTHEEHRELEAYYEWKFEYDLHLVEGKTDQMIHQHLFELRRRHRIGMVFMGTVACALLIGFIYLTTIV